MTIPSIDFVKYRTFNAVLSLGLCLGVFGFAIYKRQTTGQVFRYSVDFTGGAQVLLKFQKPVSSMAVKDIIDTQWDGAAIREFGDNEILVRIKLDAAAKELGVISERMQATVQAAMPDNQVTVLQSESVGPGVGEALRGKSIKAVILSIIAMLAYIAFRFWSVGFGLGAVLALVHDAILTLGVFLITDREISMNVIGAVLTVIGYSVNDTIVIFSQIRENMRKRSHGSLAHVVNLSINQTLRRTVLTSFATSLTVAAMLLLGGEVLRDFSLALMVGIVVGTYSSIYIASPIMMLFHRD